MIDQVPGYHILERAGDGGFSVVYRARQERLDRIVALKVLSVEAVDSDTMRRFERECQITGRLTGHPNVVTVLDTGMSTSGRPFIAMDYFERGSLRDRLSREGPLPVPDVLRTGVKIAGALAATHEAGVLHRDVKPQNILVSKYGEPALADFGIARLTESSEATHTNAFTPHHAAPEVVNGEQPGPTADVYSLASSMYQLLAGGPAFKGGAASGINALMQRILHEPPPPIQRSDVPYQVYDVIAKAMAKAPAQRYPSAVAFANRIQQLQAELGLPVTELTGSDSITAPPTPYVPETDHSGYTGPGLDALLQQFGPAPHMPAAHPDAAAPPADGAAGPDRPVAFPPSPPPTAPVSSPTPPPAVPPPSQPRRPPVAPPRPAIAPTLSPGTPAARHEAAAPRAVTRPPEATPRTLPETVERTEGPDAATAPPPERGGRGALIAGVLAAVVVGSVIGIGGFLAVSRGAGGGGDDPTTSPTPTASRAARSSAPAVPRQVVRAATPRDLRVTDKGALVVLHWKLAKHNDYPIWVQQASGSGNDPLPQALPKHTETVTLSNLDPKKGYCFTVGSLVAIGQPSTIAWSKPRCIRGASAQ